MPVYLDGVVSNLRYRIYDRGYKGEEAKKAEEWLRDRVAGDRQLQELERLRQDAMTVLSGLESAMDTRALELLNRTYPVPGHEPAAHR